MQAEIAFSQETIDRYAAAYKKYAPDGELLIKDILNALIEAKEDNYTDDDIVDALLVMGNKGDPITCEQFIDLIGVLKDPETILDSFRLFDKEKKGTIDEDDLRVILRKYAPGLKGKEIEEILEKPGTTSNGQVNYTDFVSYWAEQ